MDQLQEFFYQNPEYFGLFFSAMGIFLLIGVICDWDWIIENGEGIMDPVKMAKRWGRKGARIWMGILSTLCILLGLLYFVAYGYFLNQ